MRPPHQKKYSLLHKTAYAAGRKEKKKERRSDLFTRGGTSLKKKSTILHQRERGRREAHSYRVKWKSFSLNKEEGTFQMKEEENNCSLNQKGLSLRLP